MHPKSTTIHFNESTEFQRSEESAADDGTLVYRMPEWILEELAKQTTSGTNESAEFQCSEESAVDDGDLVYRIPEFYRTPERTLEEVTKHYEALLAIKESEIRKLFNELSELKKENQQQNHESEQIKNQYKEEIAKIPEVQQALCKQNQREIQFIVVLDDMRRDLSDQLDDIEDQLEDNYTNWIFDFEYVGHRISSQQFQQTYIEIFTRV